MKMMKRRLALVIFTVVGCHFALLFISFILVGQHSHLRIRPIVPITFASCLNEQTTGTDFPIDGTLSQKLEWCTRNRPCGRVNDSLKQIIDTCDSDPNECAEKPGWCTNCKDLLEF